MMLGCYKASMARPKKGQELQATAHLGVRLPQPVKDALDRLAADKGMDTAALVRSVLEAHLRAAERKARK